MSICELISTLTVTTLSPPGYAVSRTTYITKPSPFHMLIHRQQLTLQLLRKAVTTQYSLIHFSHLQQLIEVQMWVESAS